MTSILSRVAAATVLAATILSAPVVQAQGYGPSPGYGPTPGYGKRHDGYGHQPYNPDLKCWTTTSGRYYCGPRDHYDSYDRYGDRHDDRYAGRYGDRYDGHYDDRYTFRYGYPHARPYGYGGYGYDEHGRTCTYDRFGRLSCWYGDSSGLGAGPYQDPTEAKLYQIELKVTEDRREQARLLKELGHVEIDRLGQREQGLQTLKQAAELDPALSGVVAAIETMESDVEAHGVIVSPRIMQSSAAVQAVPETIPRAPVASSEEDDVEPATVQIEAGVIEFVLTGPYTIDAGRHAPTSLLVRWLREDGRFEEWPVDEPPAPLSPLIEGDLVAFRFGHGVAHHLGLVTAPAGDFVHCLGGHGVIQSTLKDPTYRNLLTNHFRPRWASVPPTI